MISNIETDKEKVLRIILAGQPELRETLDSERLKQLAQRVRLRFHLSALDKRDTRSYVEHRLRVAGGDPRMISEDTTDVIYRYTGGVPRLINTLCDSALLAAFVDGKKVVGVEEIMATITELDWSEHESNTGAYAKLQDIARHRPGADCQMRCGRHQSPAYYSGGR